MIGLYEVAATLTTDLGSTVKILYGTQTYAGVGADPTNNRLTFDKEINRVDIIDAGGVRSIRRKLPLIGKPIEVGVPPETRFPTASIRIEFKDIKGRHTTIYGVRTK